MPNDTLSVPTLTSIINIRLGGEFVNVEIREDGVKDCLRVALAKFNHYTPGRAEAALPATPAQKKYPITHPGLAGVLACNFIRLPLVTPGVIDPFNPMTVLGGSETASSEIGDYIWGIHRRRDMEKVLDSKPDWRGMWEGGSYFLYVDIPATYASYQVSYTYAFNYKWNEPSTVSPIHPSMIPETQCDWIVDYCVAHAKTVVGALRRKFGGVANPDGGADEVDGQTMVDEGRADKERLEDQIKTRSLPLTPQVD